MEGNVFYWTEWLRYAWAVGNTAWHLIGLFEAWRLEGYVVGFGGGVRSD